MDLSHCGHRATAALVILAAEVVAAATIVSITVVVILTSGVIVAIDIINSRRHRYYNKEPPARTTAFCETMALFQSCGACVSALKESGLRKQPRYSMLQLVPKDLVRARNKAVHRRERYLQ
jgi:hypothetical protein